jgi:hypothetical protein
MEMFMTADQSSGSPKRVVRRRTKKVDATESSEMRETGLSDSQSSKPLIEDVLEEIAAVRAESEGYPTEKDMDFEALYWKMDEPSISMEMIKGSAESNATFESKSFFREKRYYKLQGLDDVHPLVKLKHFTEKNKTREASINEISAYMGISPEYIRPMMLSYNNLGFVDFEYDEDRIVIQERLFDYVKFMAGKKDYDVIEFKSNLSGNQTNAKINLLNFDLKITGVKQIFLSDSQSVNIFPLGQTITVKKNRDFSFAGIINAGRFKFFGKFFNWFYFFRIIVFNKI